MMSNLPTLLNVEVDEKLLSLLSDHLKFLSIIPQPFLLDKLMQPFEVAPSIILVASRDFESTIECAQVLRMTYPLAAIFLCCDDQGDFERKDYILNGFSDAFLIPIDIPSLKIAMNETLSKISAERKAYRTVKMLDIEPDEILEFDTSVFMPSNNKYIKISIAGDDIDAKRLENIKKHNINNLHVPLEQIQKFYDFSAKKLRKIGSDQSFMSATEKKDKLTSSVRELMTGLFSSQNTSFETGQEVMQNCRGIVSSYILQGENANWYIRIQQVLGEFGDYYSHAANVSALAALFSMGLGVGKPEDLALAGLLHDVGESKLPIEIQGIEPEDLTREQFEKYMRHPEYSVEIIKQKKIIVPELVTKAILQHHELYDGSGFPKGYVGERICGDAQILGLADQFDLLTKIRPGKPLVTPTEAVKKMINDQADPLSHFKYNPKLLGKLLELFPG